MLNLRSILGDKAIIAILSLAAMIPMMAGRIDLTVGYGIVLWHILAIALQTQLGLPWPLAVLIVLVCAGARSACSTASWSRWRRSTRFIATLGTGTVLYALALWYTEGRQIIGVLPPGFIALYTTTRPRHPDRRPLRAGDRHRALDRQRVPADRPLPLRHRRQPARRGAQRHPGPPLRHRRLRRLGR